MSKDSEKKPETPKGGAAADARAVLADTETASEKIAELAGQLEAGSASRSTKAARILDEIGKEEISLLTGKEVYVDIHEVKNPEIDAQLVADNVCLQLERRISFRRAMKKAVQTAMDFGADGIKIRCAGRLGGSELARVESYLEGSVPLHTLRANIDYGFSEAKTLQGVLGVKCWICKGEIDLSTPEARPATGSSFLG